MKDYHILRSSHNSKNLTMKMIMTTKKKMKMMTTTTMRESPEVREKFSLQNYDGDSIATTTWCAEDLITTTPVAVNSFTSNGCDDSVSTGSDNTSHESFNLGEFNQIYQHSKSTFSNSALNSPNCY